MEGGREMSERPTPETDAEHAQFKMGGFTLDFCRKLERERDRAREDATNYYAKIGELEQERDEAREALAEAWRFADQWLALADGYLKRINEIQNDIRKN